MVAIGGLGLLVLSTRDPALEYFSDRVVEAFDLAGDGWSLAAELNRRELALRGRRRR